MEMKHTDLTKHPAGKGVCIYCNTIFYRKRRGVCHGQIRIEKEVHPVEIKKVDVPGHGISVTAVNPSKVYIVGSLRNPVIREVSNELRTSGYDVFDDWHGCGPDADDHWKVYEKNRGRSYSEALNGKLAQHAFEFDKSNLDEADVVVLVLPAGKSGHLELGYAAGKGKRTYILLEPDRDEDRWDLMYLFATAVVTDVKELLEKMND